MCAPNPMVGAVLVRDGQVVGRGWHRGPGTPHAEVAAIANAAERALGATLYVTLEPCSHVGRTPACAPAVVDAGVARVVTGMRDPNPAVDGRGFAILRDAGLRVDTGVLERECASLVEGFATHETTGLPFVMLKLAATLDGRTAARDGSSRWITGPEARRQVHLLRARAGAVIVGAGTPSPTTPSDVRLVRIRGPPARGASWSILRAHAPPAAGCSTARRPLLVATTERSGAARDAWAAAGAEVLTLPGTRRRRLDECARARPWGSGASRTPSSRAAPTSPGPASGRASSTGWCSTWRRSWPAADAPGIAGRRGSRDHRGRAPAPRSSRWRWSARTSG